MIWGDRMRSLVLRSRTLSYWLSIAGFVALSLLCERQANAQSPAPPVNAPLLVEKKVFELPAYTTVGRETIRPVRIGWQSAGTLNADRSNVILVTHHFSGTSHAFGKYAATDTMAGYWDALIGPGKAIDTNKYFVISSDTLVNLNVGDPHATTTGPASINPDTGKPWGMLFPVVTIRDFVNVQKELLASLGISRLHAVVGPSMGALQAYEWAASYPDMVGRIVPVIGAAEADGFLVGWLGLWADPIRLDPNWNNGDYYGSTPPLEGLKLALKLVTLHANQRDFIEQNFARQWAVEDRDPASAMQNRYKVESFLDTAATSRAKTSDANHFLYLVKANQLFGLAGEQRLKKIRAPALLVYTPTDLVFTREAVLKTRDLIAAGGANVSLFALEGPRGHLNGVVGISAAAAAIQAFIER